VSPTERRTTFRALHREGFFVLPNPWDVGGVRRLEALGFRAIATTSAGFAWSLGKNDLTLELEQVVDHIRVMCAATELPVNADFEGGFAVKPDGVAANVRLAVEAGAAGVSIEDQDGDRLFEPALAIERIAAAREAMDEVDPEAMLIGRTEGFLLDRPDLFDTIDRLSAYAEAGADCLYAPGVSEAGQIEAIVRAVAPKPVNVLLATTNLAPAELASLGVRRASTGASLARAAWEGFERAARELATW
jgi:2-methylisocitrate lyase-like PEP mutase family enzyme